MSFMRLIAERGTWYEVESTQGGSTLVPGDLVGGDPSLEDFADYLEGGKPESFERKEGWAARYSAPGYMDCTEWCGVYGTQAEALAACREIHGSDDDAEESDALSEDRP